MPEQDSIKTFKLSGGHLDTDSGIHRGLRQLFPEETFLVQGDEGARFTELDSSKLRQLILSNPDKKVAVFSLINQEMDNLLANIGTTTYLLNKLRDLGRPIDQKEKQLADQMVLLKKQLKALEDIEDLIGENETQGEEVEIGKKFHDILRSNRE